MMSYQKKENGLLRMAGVGHQDAGQPWLGLEDIVGGSYRLGYEQAIRELSAGLPLATQRMERDLAEAEARGRIVAEERDALRKEVQVLDQRRKEAERDALVAKNAIKTLEDDMGDIRKSLYAVTAAECRELFSERSTDALAIALIRYSHDSGRVCVFGKAEDGKLVVADTRERTEADAVANGEPNEFPF